MAPKQRAKEAGRAVLHRWGGLTQSRRALPNVLIVGAQRCGTTGLFRAMIDHPEVHGPVYKKGVHYFDVAYTEPLTWYRGHFPLTSTVDRSSSNGTQPVVVEASPYYMFHPAAPARIAADLPGVRVIALLRDPVDRALSAHKHEVARGFETLSFEDAIAAEDQRLAGVEERLIADPSFVSPAHQHQAYLARGRYVDQLQRMERALGRDRMLVLDSDRYFADPDQVLAEVYDFVELPRRAHPAVFRNESSGSSAMDPQLRAELADRMRPYDQRLSEWLGWTPSWMQ